ncbi:ribosomal protein L23/L15e core domain-containing protein [Fimicolochytrium jonesii]|uniref:ribosomal protein L23/L15e core domain-containing protein n=1 Tax=Fimicolochytrium jonesii TaxID=1396493 RepID=UPI0022FE953D|nr:ribosomal protein L23/L15e core domain-containing protein [Fimicolochytrium jonesii]KAI8822479.1 ribosomal protein L23/L15e core domain-containing protein [Fimicolochytrium jonesii]
MSVNGLQAEVGNVAGGRDGRKDTRQLGTGEGSDKNGTTTTTAAAKAQTAKKAALKGTGGKRVHKIRTKTHFYRPKTLKLARTPKYPRRSVPRTPELDAYKVVQFPLNTESAMKKIEDNNTLVFICDVRANKRQIKDAVKRLYDVDAASINTLIRPDGKKKAYVRLSADVDALDVANKIGFI